jgi:hypothetical protein
MIKVILAIVKLVLEALIPVVIEKANDTCEDSKRDEALENRLRDRISSGK